MLIFYDDLAFVFVC